MTKENLYIKEIQTLNKQLYNSYKRIKELRKEKLMFTLKQIKRIAKKIKANDRWVNDSHSSREYMGICDGLDMLVEHLEELERNK